MKFTEKDKMKALAIVHVFETGKPFGDYAACVVLNDGAGISYGINQFTHRSGSLAAVVKAYLATPAVTGRQMLASKLPMLNDRSDASISSLAADREFRRVLSAAAAVEEMRSAQREIAYTRYLKPALDVCDTMRFDNPLSLAVVYDSLTHGSWDWIAARVNAVVHSAGAGAPVNEKAWITEYVRRRHRWLTEIRRLRVTNYRTKFFLDQIAIGNWDLRLPISVQGVSLTEELFRDHPTTGERVTGSNAEANEASAAEEFGGTEPEMEMSAGDLAAAAMNGFEKLDTAIVAATRRSDAAKSMWAAIGGSVTQAAWAVFGFFVGLPREIWVVVALIAAAFMLLYLYRQLVLGRIRETSAGRMTPTNDHE